MHAWIAIRAIDRLAAIAEQVKSVTPQDVDSYESIQYFVELLRNRIGLVVEGAWIPDNVIHDNNPAHIWKYEPLLKQPKKIYDSIRDGKPTKGCYVEENGKRIYYQMDHASAHSLSYLEAQNAYAFDKFWRKSTGQLADRTIAVHQMMRDLILFQRDEMLNIVASLIHKFPDDMVARKAEVEEFLKDPATLKDFYDKELNGVFINRRPIIDIRNAFRQGKRQDEIRECLSHFGGNIQHHIELLNCLQFMKCEHPVFPMFFSNDEIALIFFSLSHYVADAHMPLHCDSRTFSDSDCNKIHYQIEDAWDRWILKSNQVDSLTKNLSETNRGKEFLSIVFGDDDYVWSNFRYPDNQTILRDFDALLGQDVWVNRKFRPFLGSGWPELVGITYASYCLCSRLLQFDDGIRVVPYGSTVDYQSGYDGTVKPIKGRQWKTSALEDGIEGGLDTFPDDDFQELNDLRKKIFQFVKARGGSQPCFKYLSLLILVDAVENSARLWAKTIIDHLKVPYVKPI